MNQTTAPLRYNTLSQLFHWSVVLMLVGLVVTDSLRDGAPKESALRTEWLHLHESIGILLFLVVIARILWSRLSPQPSAVPNIAATCAAAPDPSSPFTRPRQG
jgi:cytochrome b561